MSNPLQDLIRHFRDLSTEDLREYYHTTPQKVSGDIKDEVYLTDRKIETLGFHDIGLLAKDEWGPIKAAFDRDEYRELRRNPDLQYEIIEGFYEYKDALGFEYTAALIATLKRAYDNRDVSAFEAVRKASQTTVDWLDVPILESETEEGIRLREAIAYVGEVLDIPEETEPIDFVAMIGEVNSRKQTTIRRYATA